VADSAMSPEDKEPAQILDEAEAKIFAIGESAKRQTTGFLQIPQLLEKAIERVDELFHQNNPDDVSGIPTGFNDLDQLTAGLQAGDLIIVAGRPSMGKTAFSLNMAEHIAIDQGLPVAVFSMEMSAQQLALRMLGSLARVNQSKLRTGRITDDDWPKLMDAVTRAQRAPLYIDETAGLNSFELRARARRLAKTCGRLGLIVVDYLQLMTASTGRNENRAAEISEISRSLKSLAKELQCPLIALSQLNRSLEQRPDKRPIMSDLRESGSIEQDADLILCIYRDEVYNKESRDKGTAEIIIRKQRNGSIGTVRMTFLGEYTRFENYASQGGAWEAE
jgi:replicative DNA helicase